MRRIQRCLVGHTRKARNLTQLVEDVEGGLRNRGPRVFDERNPALKAFIPHIIQAAKAIRWRSGLGDQAPMTIPSWLSFWWNRGWHQLPEFR